MSTTTQLLSLLLSLLITQISYAQTYYGLNGRVVDEAGTTLVGATVLLLNMPDSTMEEYALTNEKGIFKITAPKSKDYLIQVSYMGYEDHSQLLSLNEKMALGDIVLKEKTELLNAVEVTEERIPIRMKGDTLEYAADAFETKEHDNVENLLKQLPGVQVDRDGSVKAQGEAVDRILVDGKEFFGDNPEIAMKNLPADAVDKVQVYDRKSEMAEFSGVDDGVKKKTINLKLKKDKKHGFFGNIAAGYGHDVPSQPNSALSPHRYKGNLSLNYFNPSMRLSTIGAINNINEQSFSFMDYINMMGGIQSLMSGGTSLNLEMNGDDPLASLLMGNSNGIARTVGGGVNFNWFISDKTEWSTHYFYSILNKQQEETSLTRSIGLQNYFARSSRLQNNINLGHHNINTIFKHKFDPTQDLKVQLKFKFSDTKLQRSSSEQSLDNADVLQNEVYQDYAKMQKGWGINGNTLYRKKLKKKGRVFMANALFGYGYNNNNNQNISTTNLYNNAGQLQVVDSLNQDQNQLNHNYIYGAELSFVEPIGKKNFLETKLVGIFNIDRRDQTTYEVAETSRTLNPFLSNLFQKEYNYQTLRTRFQHTKKAYTFTAEAALQRSYLKGVFSNGQADLARTYYYPLGSLALDYKITKGSSLNIRYGTAIKEPQIQQLQPILDNNSPLALFEGNPNLNPAYHHHLELRYNLFDQFSFTSFFANVSFSLLQQPIVNTQTISDNLVTTYRPENSDVGYRGRLYLNFSRPIKPLGIMFDLGLTGELNQVTTLVNNIKNEQLTHNYIFKANIENRKKKVLDIAVGTRIEWNNSLFSVNNALNTTYFNYMAYADVGVTIAKKWQLKSDLQYNIYTDPNFDEQIYIPMWSASISRTFLKGNQLKIELKAFNLLDQTINVNRYNQGETIAEQRAITIGRYLMLSLKYKLTQVGAKKEEPAVFFKEER